MTWRRDLRKLIEVPNREAEVAAKNVEKRVHPAISQLSVTPEIDGTWKHITQESNHCVVHCQTCSLPVSDFTQLPLFFYHIYTNTRKDMLCKISEIPL